MGIYTNAAFGGYTSSNYTSVEPFKGDHFNYHELGIIAAAESAANQNAFMKAIALQELASMEQYGNTDILYESVNIKGIFEKIKAFFKKIIEKVHKIFHTFVAKMQSWFGNNKSFAQKYEKEVLKNWSKVSNDFEFKGYVFTNIATSKAEYEKDFVSKDVIKTTAQTTIDALEDVLSNPTAEKFKNVLSNYTVVDVTQDISKIRDKMDDIKDKIRGNVIETIAGKARSNNKSLDSNEFTEELFKIYRNGEDDKQDLNKSKVLESYNGSVNGMMTFIKEFDKIKTELEKSEKAVTKGIDKIIDTLNKVENDLIKDNREHTKTTTDSDASEKEKKAAKKAIDDNEAVVGLSSIIQSVLGFEKEVVVQAFGAELQAVKDACSQAKEIAVKVIGLNKKMTESTDYSSYNESAETTFGGDFISAVKLV